MNAKIHITLAVIVALSILITAYVANGSEHEDAWLYILAAWIAVSPLIDLYTRKKDK